MHKEDDEAEGGADGDDDAFAVEGVVAEVPPEICVCAQCCECACDGEAEP